MSRPAAAIMIVAAVATAAGGSYAWALHRGQAGIRQAAEQIRAGLGPGGAFSYAAADVQPLQRSADLSSVTLRTPSGVLFTAGHVALVSSGDRLASVHATGVRVSRADEDGAVTAASLDARDVTYPLPVTGQPLVVDPAAVTFADMTLHAVAFVGPGASARLASLNVRDYGAGHKSTLTASGLSVPVPAVEHIDHAGFASLTASGIDLAAMVDAVEHDTKVPQPSAGPVRFEIEGLYATDGDSKPVFVRRVLLSGTKEPDGASSANIEVSGVSLEPMDAATKARFAALGLTRLNGSLSSLISYRLADGAFEMTPAVNVEGFGDLALDLRLGHLDAAALGTGTPNLLSLFALAQTTRLVSAYARLADAGLIDRVLASRAQETGIPKDQLRAQAVAHIRQDPSFALLPNGEQARAALASFVAHGGTLGVTIQPPAPVSVMELLMVGRDNPAALASLLGLSISRN